MPYTVSSPEFARFRELARQANSDAPVFLTHYQAEQDLHSAVASILLLLASLSPRVFKNLCCVLLLPPRASCQGPSAGEHLDCGRYRHLRVRLVCGGRRGPSDQRDHREPAHQHSRQRRRSPRRPLGTPRRTCKSRPPPSLSQGPQPPIAAAACVLSAADISPLVGQGTAPVPAPAQVDTTSSPATQASVSPVSQISGVRVGLSTAASRPASRPAPPWRASAW